MKNISGDKVSPASRSAGNSSSAPISTEKIYAARARATRLRRHQANRDQIKTQKRGQPLQESEAVLAAARRIDQAHKANRDKAENPAGRKVAGPS